MNLHFTLKDFKFRTTFFKIWARLFDKVHIHVSYTCIKNKNERRISHFTINKRDSVQTQFEKFYP